IQFSLEKNGQLAQSGNTSDLLFQFDQIISYISNFFTLQMGDVIFTGTPAGVGPVQLGDTLSAYLENEKLLEFNIK
nr:fumarylacetoacetate hydrolase family protein [Chitinophagaceae bacterium]